MSFCLELNWYKIDPKSLSYTRGDLIIVKIQAELHISVLRMSTSLSDRVFDPSSLDIDFNAVFERLLSPKGIVQQFLLSIALQIMNILGFTISGLGYAAIVRNTPPGPFLDFVKFFDIILTPQVIIDRPGVATHSSFIKLDKHENVCFQAIAKTVIRSLLRLLFDLGGRTVTTAFLFGVTESVSTTEVEVTTVLF